MIGILSVLFTVYAAQAEVPKSPKTGAMEIRAATSYFSTDANYPSGGGSSTSLPNNGQLTSIQGDFLFGYDWQPDWRLISGFNVGWVETDDGTFERSNSGLNEVFFEGQKWFEMGPLDVTTVGDFAYPLWRADQDGGDDALYGEGAMRARISSYAIYPMGNFKPFGYIGFEYRDEGRSFLLPYSIGGHLRLGSMWLQAELRGLESVVDDADSENRSDRETYLRQVNGGSFKYYPMNPSQSEIAIEAGLNFNSWSIFGGVAMTVAGASAADGMTFMAGLSITPDFRSTQPKPAVDDNFQVPTESYDESLFREPEIKKQQKTEPDEAIAQPQAQPAKPAKSPKQQAIEESQEVEMQVELHHVDPVLKKKKKRSKKNLDKLMNDAEKALEKKN